MRYFFINNVNGKDLVMKINVTIFLSAFFYFSAPLNATETPRSNEKLETIHCGFFKRDEDMWRVVWKKPIEHNVKILRSEPSNFYFIENDVFTAAHQNCLIAVKRQIFGDFMLGTDNKIMLFYIGTDRIHELFSMNDEIYLKINTPNFFKKFSNLLDSIVYFFGIEGLRNIIGPQQIGIGKKTAVQKNDKRLKCQEKSDAWWLDNTCYPSSEKDKFISHVTVPTILNKDNCVKFLKDLSLRYLTDDDLSKDTVKIIRREVSLTFHPDKCADAKCHEILVSVNQCVLAFK
jgi:hypothetical protein